MIRYTLVHSRDLRLCPTSIGGDLLWAYLGRDLSRQEKWQTALGVKAQIPLSSLIEKKAWSLRRPYAEWIGEMGERYGSSMLWWTTDLAEKNTATSDLFLLLCYLEIVLNEFVATGPVLLVIEDWSLYCTLVNILRHQKILFSQISAILPLVARGVLAEWFRFLGRWGVKFPLLLWNFIVARRSRKGGEAQIQLGPPTVLIHTCIDDACLQEDGSFKDRYFPRLPEWLRARGYQVVTIVWPYNIKKSLTSAYHWFRNANDLYLIPEDFLRLRDYFGAAITVLRQLGVPSGTQPFKSRDISWLLWRERIRQASAVGKIRFLLYGQVIKHLREHKLCLDSYVDTFENMWTEKPAAKAVHDHYPHARVIGFQHATINPFMLKYLTTPQEIARAANVFPDHIFCNGRVFFDVLLRNGVPRSMLRDGPALRYLYLWEKTVTRRQSEIILVVLPLNELVAVNLLGKILSALQGIPQQKILKCHPMIDRKAIMHTIGISELPEGFDWAEGEINIWLGKAFCVVGAATAAIFEAAIFGVPVVVVGNEGELPFNPLAWWEKDCPEFSMVYSESEIRQRVSRFVKSGDVQWCPPLSVDEAFSSWQEEGLSSVWPRV